MSIPDRPRLAEVRLASALPISATGLSRGATMNTAIAARLDDLITLAGRLKATVEAERPGALVPMFPLVCLGADADAMVNALQGHIERLSPPEAVPRDKA